MASTPTNGKVSRRPRLEPLRCPDELGDDAGLGHRVAAVGDDAVFCLGPSAVEVPGDRDRRAEIVTAVDDDAGDRGQARRVGDELAIELEEAAVLEIVRLDARESDRIARLAEGR